jgi:hypothetical protein
MDISIWCSELKTVIVDVTPSAYDLTPPSNIPARDRAEWIKTTATTLLAESLFLQGGLNENVSGSTVRLSRFQVFAQGKTRNFAHPALQNVITEFFYLGTYCIADK